jgi:hypothetical protein
MEEGVLSKKTFLFFHYSFFISISPLCIALSLAETRVASGRDLGLCFTEATYEP